MARVLISPCRSCGYPPWAARAAAIVGDNPVEFTVWVDGWQVAAKGGLFIPSDRKIIQAVWEALAGP